MAMFEKFRGLSLEPFFRGKGKLQISVGKPGSYQVHRQLIAAVQGRGSFLIDIIPIAIATTWIATLGLTCLGDYINMGCSSTSSFRFSIMS